MSDENTRFEDTVGKITEEYGAEGFTAKKTAAADILKSDIDTFGDDGNIGVAASVLDRLADVQSNIDASRDPESVKESMSVLKDIKDTIKILQKSKDLDKDQSDRLNKIVDETSKNVKKSAKSGGALGKANQNFIQNLTDTLNPLKQAGNLLENMGLSSAGQYLNEIGDIGGDKFLNAIGMKKSVGTSDEAIKDARNARKSAQSEIDTGPQQEANLDQSVLTKEGETSSKGVEEGEGSMTAEDLLMPSLSLVPRAKKRLGVALGLTDASGTPFLQSIAEYLKPEASSRAEGAEGGMGLPDLELGDGDAEVPDDIKPKGILGKLFLFLSRGLGGIFTAIGAILMSPFKLIKGLMGKIGTGIVAKIGLRGALAGTLAGIPIVGWLAALVLQGIFGIFGGLKGVYEEGKNNPDATLGDKLWAFFDGFISEFFTFGAVSREKIAEFRGKIKDGFLNIMDGIYDGVKNAIDNAIAAVKNIGSSIKNFGSNLMDKGKDFLKGAIRSILPRKDPDGEWWSIGNLAMKAIPESVYKFAGIDKETGEDIPEPPKVQTADIEGVDARQGLTETLGNATDAVNSGSTSGNHPAASMMMNTGGNVNTTNNTTNNTTANASPQDQDFDYYAFRGVNVHA
jgi:hypothetical protein